MDKTKKGESMKKAEKVDQWLFQPEDESKVGGGKAKEDRYDWMPLNKQGVMSYIDKTKLFIDREYQRKMDTNRARRIANSLDWPRFGVLTVFKRDGKFMVADGQHRFLASMKRSDIDKVPCIVFECDEKSEEAKAFIAINTGSKGVHPIDKYNAGIVAKEDTYALMKKLFNELGISVPANSGGHSKIPKQCRCVSFVYNAIKARGEMVIRDVLNAALISNPPEDIAERVLKALLFIHDKNGGISNAMLNDIQRVGHEFIKKRIMDKVMLLGKGGERVYAQGLCDALNFRKRGGQLWRIE